MKATHDSRPEFLLDAPGRRTALLGNLAIVRGAMEAGVQFVSGYPGTPASEIGDAFARIAADGAEVLFEYSVNEKVAVESAFAACLTGARSLCSMKHLGLNYALDPAATMPYVGVEGGLVIVSAGDPSAITSPNEQDQRHFTRFLFYPVFDPATADDALRMTRYAFEFSEATRLPVILRPTTRVCHASGMVELGPLPTERRPFEFKKNPPRYVPIPPNARRMRLELKANYARAEELLTGSSFYPRTGTGRSGILAGGVGYAYARQVVDDLDLGDRVTLLQAGAYPVPDSLLTAFLADVDRVLVVEELTPFLEDWVTRVAYRQGKLIPIHGKHDGRFPEEYEYTPDQVEAVIRDHLDLKPRPVATILAPELPERPPVLCPGCPHRASMHLTRRVFGKKTVYCNDIGCYTLGYGQPLDCCDTLLCMGSSISQASAIARTTGRRTVAFIGDSTFFHSGLPALAGTVRLGANVTVAILNNFVTAMTGFQPSLAGPEPGAESSDTGAASVSGGLDLEAAVRGLGVADVRAVDPFDEAASLEALKALQSGEGANVVIFNAPCVVDAVRSGAMDDAVPFTVEEESCNGCSLCVRMLGCPGILVENGEFSIDRKLCTGCELCARLCKHGAIREVTCDD